MHRAETSLQLAAFEDWYGGARDFRETSLSLSVNLRTLYDWAGRYDWYARRDERDAKARVKADAAAVDRTAKFLEAQQQAGELLRMRGIEFFANGKIDDVRAAIAAIKEGVSLERQSMGLADNFVKVDNALDTDGKAAIDALDSKLSGLAARIGASDISGEPDTVGGASS